MPPALTPAPTSVRRLSPVEIRNSVSDVLLGGAGFDTDIQLDSGRHDFDNQYGGANVTLRFAEDLLTTAERAADQYVARLADHLPCARDIAANAEPSCFDTFLDGTARRVFRRPLTEGERTNLRALFADLRTSGDFAHAMGGIIEAMLQSPSFVFRTELGADAPDRKGVVTLSPFELAAAMSYFLWRSAPDEDLLDAAEAGRLSTADAIDQQTRRMLKDERARRGVRDFFAQWLEVEQLQRGLEKSDPAFTPGLRQAMWEETGRFVETLVLEEDGGFDRLLREAHTFANRELASLYGVEGPKGSALEPVALDKAKRAGVLTQPGFLAVHSSPSGFSPIFLGMFVRQKLFCQPLGQPPADFPAPSKDPNLSTRDKFAAHSDSPACKGCHALMDPIGFGFERYDSLGRYREFEMLGDRSVPLTGAGNLAGTDVDGDFIGPVALADRLASSSEVADCMVGQLMKFLLGRDTARPDNRLDIDAAAITGIRDEAGSVQSVMLALLKTPGLHHRQSTLSAQGDEQP